MFMLVEYNLETFGSLVVPEISVEQFKSTPLSLVGREYALMLAGWIVMQLPSAENWDMQVEIESPLLLSPLVQEVNLYPGVSIAFPVLLISAVALHLVGALSGLVPVIPPTVIRE